MITEWYWWVATAVGVFVSYHIGLVRDNKQHETEHLRTLDHRVNELSTRLAVMEQSLVADHDVDKIIQRAVQPILTRMEKQEVEIKQLNESLHTIQLNLARFFAQRTSDAPNIKRPFRKGDV